MNRRTLAFALMVVTALSLALPQMAAAAMRDNNGCERQNHS